MALLIALHGGIAKQVWPRILPLLRLGFVCAVLLLAARGPAQASTPFMAIRSVVTTYDANNNVVSVTETKETSEGGTLIDKTVNTYDDFDRLETSSQTHDDGNNAAFVATYTYNNNGNRTSVTTDNGKSVSYTYDQRNRLETAVVDSETTTYSYTPDSQVARVDYPTGAVAVTTYYPNNRTESIVHKDAGGSVISSFAYQYDHNGNRTQQIEVQGGATETTDYLYDDLDRLESFTVNDGTTTTVTAYSFEGYNRKTETVTVDTVATVNKTYAYDETNWLDRIDDSVAGNSISYQYDANGNTILKTDSAKPGEDVQFDYDVANRLMRTLQGASDLGRYDYNAAGMRIRHYSSERGDVEYFYDDGAVLEEYQVGVSGGLLAHYRYGDRLLSLEAPNDGGVQYYHHDALGSTVNLTDSAGNTKVSYLLDPWGHIRNQIGSSVNRSIFTGQEHDENTGLIYFGARYYDPDSARFISQDSYLGEAGTPPSLHRYLYAYSNPTVYFDLDGHLAVTEDISKKLDEGGDKIAAGMDDMPSVGENPAVLPAVVVNAAARASVVTAKAAVDTVDYAGNYASLYLPTEDVETKNATARKMRDAVVAPFQALFALITSEDARGAAASAVSDTVVGAMSGDARKLSDVGTVGATVYMAAHLVPKASATSEVAGEVAGLGDDAVRLSGPAHSSANAVRLKTQLAFEEAGILTPGGSGLTEEAIAAAREIPVSGGKLTNPEIVEVLTRGGENITDWSKYTTQSVKLSSGQNAQIHFYKHKNGKVDLTTKDFKVKGDVQ